MRWLHWYAENKNVYNSAPAHVRLTPKRRTNQVSHFFNPSQFMAVQW